MKEKQEIFIAQQVAELRGIVVKGFEGVHQRQDTTNGRLGKVEDRVLELEEDNSFERGKSKGISAAWGATLAIAGIVIGLLTAYVTYIKQ